MDPIERVTERVPLPITETPGVSTTLDQPIQFEPLTSTVLVQQIQSQLGLDTSQPPETPETDDGVNVLEECEKIQTDEENHEITQQKQSNSSCVVKNLYETEDESKFDEITDTANTLKISSTAFVESCETIPSTICSKNNNNDDEYINKNIKVAENDGNDEERKKDILEYLVTFSDSTEELKKRKESEVSDKPPIPLPTYLWEDLKKAKEQGAYPWTHLYKRKFDPDDPVVFSTFPKKTSPKPPKKVRIQEETLNTGSVPNLFENPPPPEHFEKLETTFDKEEASSSDVPASSDAPASPKSILKRSHDEPATEDSKAVAAGSSKTPKLKDRFKSFNDNIKNLAEKQMEKLEKAKRHIKKIPLSGKELVFHEKQKILRLKHSPKSGKHEFVSYLEKQDSDDTVEIVVLDESPSNARKHVESDVPVPDEIIELNKEELKDEDHVVPICKEKDAEAPQESLNDEVELNFTEQTVPQIIEPPVASDKKVPPPKAPRKQKGHIYEDIEDAVKIDPLMFDIMDGQKEMMESLKIQDQLILKELKQKSEEEEDTLSALTTEVKPQALLAPISSIDSTSSDEDRERRNTLPALVEESDTGMSDVESEIQKKEVKQDSVTSEEPKKDIIEIKTVDEPVVEEVHETVTVSNDAQEEKLAEPSSEPKETPTETPSDTIKEDVPLASQSPTLTLPSSEKVTSRWSAMSDHEYEPIGQPEDKKPAPPSPDVQMSAQEFQTHLEDRFFNQAPAPSKPDVVVTAPSFDEAAKPSVSVEPEKRKKSFMASAQEQGRLFQRKLSSQADSLKTKFSNLKKPKPDEEHKEEVVVETVDTITETTTTPKKRFQKPDFKKLKGHLPEFKRPEMPKMKKPNFEKIKAMKRPSFDRPRMPEIPKMDFNKHLQSMKKLGRSKSVKEENEEQPADQVTEIVEETETITSTGTVPTKKKRFEIDFRTYPRMITNKFKKTKKPPVPSARTLTPVLKPRVKGRKQELDTDSGQFTEYNKDIDLDRETSVERRMRVHLEKAIEEYRQIEEEETKQQQQEAKQASLPRKKKGKKVIPQPESFDSRDFDFNQNEMDSEGASKASTQELQDIIKRSQIRPFGRTDTQSLQSGDRRGVLEEIDDDQFFLRKKGISEDNIQMGEYISSAIREGLMDPVNVLAQMGQYDDYQLDEEEMRYLQEIEKQGSDFQLELDQHLMPSKPGRRQKKQSSEEVSDDQHKWDSIKDIDEDSVEISQRDFSRFVPPTPPKRRKKRSAPLPKVTKNLNGFEEHVPSQHQEITVYRQEQIPLAKAESGDSFIPIPPSRTSRSRSQSVLKDENRPINVIEEDKLSLEVPGYAVIKKDPPPRPPAPQPRRSKSTRSHERPFKTMPHLKTDEPKPERPARNYSTIIPDRPPRKPVTDEKRSLSGTPYEKVSETNIDEVVKKLQSGEILNKMKDRPLPAPPRPPREKTRKSDQKQPSTDDDHEDQDDKGGSAVRAVLDTADSFTDNEYKVEEIDVWCQTDPLPDDFQLEELEITEDMRTITPTMYRESVRDDHPSHVSERFSRPETPSIEQELQRIREGRPSSRLSHTSRTPSRPTTPALVYVERKITTPLGNNEEQIEASLTAHQVEIDFDEETGNVIVTGLVSDPVRSRVVDERKEEDVLKGIEDEIVVPKEVAIKKEEIKPVEEAKKEFKPVQEPIIEPIRAPVRYEPEPEPVPVDQEPPVMQPVEPVLPTSVTPLTPVTPIAPQQPTLLQQTPDQPLHLSNLSVDRLSVNELQASKISVSELDSSSINSNEIQCQSGNLSMRSIEIPPGVIEEIVERVNRVQREQSARQSPVSIPPASFHQLSPPTETEPIAPPRRSRQPAQSDDQPEQPPSILSLTGQLANACGSELSRHGSNLINYLRSFSKDENRRDMHFVLFVLIIIIAGLFMIGMDHSDRTVHHHHWDFFNPPKNGDK